MSGMVVLVGAGPSNIELLTLAGRDAILAAEVVVYDKLVSQDILDLIPANAEKINVGKNVGHHPVPQGRINEILLEQALAGKYVVRLKGGDSYLFGRGGEEVALLQQHGVPFKVIPGISSSLSVGTYAGIPVTHRDFSSSVHIITGHKKQGEPLVLDYDALVRLNGTLIFMMSIASAPDIMQGLLQAGMASDMPAAIIENGTSAKQRKVITTACTLAQDLQAHQIVSPAIVMVGKVCALDFDWFGRLPLFGKKILVTRPKKNANKLANALRQAGADVTIASTIETQPIAFALPVLDAIGTLVFTSANGVSAFCDALFAAGLDARACYGKTIAAIGYGTQKELRRYGLAADFLPSVFDGKTLGEELSASQKIKGEVLLVRGTRSEETLQGALQAAGVPYTELVCYETHDVAAPALDLTQYDMVTFASASAVTSFVHQFPAHENLHAVCIGKMTQVQAALHGFSTTVSEQATIESLVLAVKEFYHAR